jgi:hypothetical protein
VSVCAGRAWLLVEAMAAVVCVGVCWARMASGRGHGGGRVCRCVLGAHGFWSRPWRRSCVRVCALPRSVNRGAAQVAAHYEEEWSATLLGVSRVTVALGRRSLLGVACRRGPRGQPVVMHVRDVERLARRDVYWSRDLLLGSGASSSTLSRPCTRLLTDDRGGRLYVHDLCNFCSGSGRGWSLLALVLWLVFVDGGVDDGGWPIKRGVTWGDRRTRDFSEITVGVGRGACSTARPRRASRGLCTRDLIFNT